MALITVEEASVRLGVTSRRIRQLAAEGHIDQRIRGYVDSVSVDNFSRLRAGRRVRAWSVETAWAALALLSGQHPWWVGAAQRSRLRARLRDLDAQGFVSAVRNRATETRFSAHPSVRERLTQYVISTEGHSGELGLAESGKAGGYISPNTAEQIIQGFGLIQDSQGEVLLRVTDFDLEVVAELARDSAVLLATDLTPSPDVRAHHAGVDYLQGKLEAFLG